MEENLKNSMKILKKSATFSSDVDDPFHGYKYVPLSRIDFDITIIDRWSELCCKNAPKRRCLHLSFIYNDYFYVYGGLDIREGNMTDLKRLQIKNVSNLSWEDIETSGVQPDSLSGIAGCLIGSNFYLFGGENNREMASNSLFILDLELNKWEKRIFSESMIPGLFGHTMHYFQFENSLIIFGGFFKGNYKNSIYSFSIEKNDWSKIDTSDPQPQGRINHTSALVNDDLIIFAGKNDSSNLSDMWKFNLITKVWTEIKYKNASLNEIPEARSGQSLVYHASSKSLYIFGGKTANLQEKNDMWKFDLQTEKFTLVHDTLLEQFNNFDMTQSNFMNKSTMNNKSKTMKKGFNKSVGVSDNSSRQDSQLITLKNNTTTKSFQKLNQNEIQAAKNSMFEEMLLNSPSSKKMKNALIYKIDIADAQNLKTMLNNMLSICNITQDTVKTSRVPHPRDCHTATLYDNSMIIFGGDRNKFPYNDLFAFSIQ